LLNVNLLVHHVTTRLRKVKNVFNTPFYLCRLS